MLRKDFVIPSEISAPSRMSKQTYSKEPLLVAIGTHDDVRSSIWRLWVYKDDVYFGTAEGSQAFKFSLHKSGIWRAAFVRSLDKDGRTDRAAKKWDRPSAGAGGMTSAIAVVAAPSGPSKPFTSRRRNNDQRIRWVPPAPPTRMVVLFVMIANSDADTDPIVFAQDRLVGRLKKANGETVCVVANERAITPEIAAKIKEVRTNLKIHVPKEVIEKQQLKYSRALMCVSDDIIGPTNPPTIFDVEIGWESVVSN